MNKKETSKKQWAKPVVKNLDVRDTEGGTTAFPTEDLAHVEGGGLS
ncbi:MAG: hypothetical protein HC896_05415 [Bacteroidales bacterium]|nr:hypothetical protein [Bacteroidales bacterium]